MRYTLATSTPPPPSQGSSLLATLARRLLWNLLPAALIVVSVWAVVFGDEGLLIRSGLKARLHNMEQRVDSIEAENQLMKAEIRRLQTDPVELRRAAAASLLAAEPGSTLYRLEPSPRSTTP